MVHPLHPDHPQYADLVEAGRAGPGRFIGLGMATDDGKCLGNVVIGSYTDHVGIERFSSRRCSEPGPYLIKHPVFAHEQRRCDVHFRSAIFDEDGTPRAGVTWRVACSSCNEPADYRSRLDHDGRCESCRP